MTMERVLGSMLPPSPEPALAVALRAPPKLNTLGKYSLRAAQTAEL